ncbi:hypothetical protein [Alicyclobacillus mengziensis]|uniref:GGDEF domain-containing protein n=1 Tax=Alicyclobacillus mengziensis TaxID=2931921 RepID=A0A9X7VYE4_9BACL|nr:hypothetical protein [Alicyclobacillus mengziensis]QSO47381.1 hypothetical protein JZ786_23840 [Alicyclobacillus mengziensis]
MQREGLVRGGGWIIAVNGSAVKGDALLMQIGRLMQMNLNEYNGICARIGGDEFIHSIFTASH